jgi:hypothetical protein
MMIFLPQKMALGPLFVATSCGTCHAGDGKGHPFTTLTRFGQSDSTGNHFLDKGGPQLQNRAIPAYQPEQIPAGRNLFKIYSTRQILALDFWKRYLMQQYFLWQIPMIQMVMVFQAGLTG